VPQRHPVDERREAGGETSGRLVALLLREPCVAGEVDEADRRGSFDPLVQAGALEHCLGRLDGVLRPHVLAVPFVDRGERGPHQRGHVTTGRGSPPHQLRRARSRATTRILDLFDVEVGFRGHQPSEVVRVGAEQSPDRILGAADVEDAPSEVRDHDVVGPGQVVRVGRDEPHRPLDRRQQIHRHPPLLGELAVRPVQPWRELPPGRFEEVEGQLSGRRRGQDRFRGEAGLLPHVQEGRDVSILLAVALALRPDHAQVDQTADVGDVDSRAPGDVLDRELHPTASSGHDGRSLGG
jgi:hypothetical protein